MRAGAVRETRRRVVVTGYGAVTPVGPDVPSLWQALLSGRSGIGTVTGFDPDGLPVTIAGEVRDFDPLVYMPKRAVRRLDPFAQYALAAAVQAVDAAGLTVPVSRPDRMGVLIGSGYGAEKTIIKAAEALITEGPRGVSPYFAVSGGSDSAAVEVAMRFGAQGPSGSMSTACATGATCIGDAARMIATDVADVMVAGASDDCLTKADMAATAKTGVLSRRNDDPAGASRPFDLGRDGFVMSAGAGVVLLEEAGHAMRRGAEILAEVAGYAATTDAYHLTSPDPEGRGLQRAMRLALSDADADVTDIDYINAHATGTDGGDRVEITALRQVFGERLAKIPLTSVKSVLGHMMGAASAVDLIATVEAMRTGTVPPTTNCTEPEDPELDFGTREAGRREIRTAMSNSFGFGGHNAVLVVRSFDGG
ncbi:beta-ketoacyl-[acyl-carrier-protein] synthase family protein [Streptomyces hiroshimensis]|uniref:3-oxoacyl-[acyl-carrier-protein] synthase 2 n=1 Tax=Streptomyces hiroshimensis TaxID=66424 RepID=A0ABQ2Y4T3_9ACTN|nr:beta-ketoacyl-ACP synthase II [Streptomyces hiroshimensis]GGX62190.1 3-oxoacyl-[acyl-carrier-protein] synthase 2 [Streptomyces hiroshimensis]